MRAWSSHDFTIARLGVALCSSSWLQQMSTPLATLVLLGLWPLATLLTDDESSSWYQVSISEAGIQLADERVLYGVSANGRRQMDLDGLLLPA